LDVIALGHACGTSPMYVYAYDFQGQPLPGFPVSRQSALATALPAVGDVDGDARPEIVVATENGLAAWNHDGTAVPGWPPTLIQDDDYIYDRFSSPAIADIDADGVQEVVVACIEQDVSGWPPVQHTCFFALNGDGTVLPGWPVIAARLQESADRNWPEDTASPVLADLEGDGEIEMIAPFETEDEVAVFGLGQGSARPFSLSWPMYAGNAERTGEPYPLICDATGLPGEDCNGNGERDLCDLLFGTSGDCNSNGIPDECDIASGLSLDCNENGIPDSCDVTSGGDCNSNGIPDECDIASGLSLDCNSDGVPDECLGEQQLEIVYVMDTSGSMSGVASTICDRITAATESLANRGEVNAVYLGIYGWPAIRSDSAAPISDGDGVAEDPGGTRFQCLNGNVADSLGTEVPADPPAGLENLTSVEDWGLATAVVAGMYDWSPMSSSLRLIIPMSDEGPYRGDFLDIADEQAIEHAIQVACGNGCVVAPMVCRGVTHIIPLAEALAESTGGTVLYSSYTAQQIATAIESALGAGWWTTDCNSNGIPDDCDIESGISPDTNENGIPDECEGSSGIDGNGVQSAFRLEANYPNPFNPSTSIRFSIPHAAHARLVVYDVAGRQVATLVDERLTAGMHEVMLHADHLASGVYFCRLEADGRTQARKMVLIQ
ncbi:MAG: T9SS type A sorting domain-containing protein, partial [Candidatus Eisenbacteria bacterium]|nr:T9SS type A sorting domain-containing protein [Candidatus Eisenbacteria bacterium]